MHETDQKQALIINANYELFVILVTLLSIVNSVLWLFPLEPYTRSVIQIIEYIISSFLLLDFFIRLIRAHDKRAYLFQYYGWLDFVGSLPVFGLRLARLARVFILVRKIRRDDLAEMGNVVVEKRAQSTLLVVIFLASSACGRGALIANQVTLFKSVGVAVQDAAAARLALENARQFGLGVTVDW